MADDDATARHEFDEMQRHVLTFLSRQDRHVRPVTILGSIADGWTMLHPVLEGLAAFEAMCLVDRVEAADGTFRSGAPIHLYAITDRGRRALASLPPPRLATRLRAALGLGLRLADDTAWSRRTTSREPTVPEASRPRSTVADDDHRASPRTGSSRHRP